MEVLGIIRDSLLVIQQSCFVLIPGPILYLGTKGFIILCRPESLKSCIPKKSRFLRDGLSPQDSLPECVCVPEAVGYVVLFSQGMGAGEGLESELWSVIYVTDPQ